MFSPFVRTNYLATHQLGACILLTLPPLGNRIGELFSVVRLSDVLDISMIFPEHLCYRLLFLLSLGVSCFILGNDLSGLPPPRATRAPDGIVFIIIVLYPGWLAYLIVVIAVVLYCTLV